MPDDDSTRIAWACTLSEAVAPFATGGVYINFMPEDEAGGVEHAYSANYRRLAEIRPAAARLWPRPWLADFAGCGAWRGIK